MELESIASEDEDYIEPPHFDADTADTTNNHLNFVLD